MGVNVGTQSNSNVDYPKSIERMSEILGYRFITPWMKSDFMFRLSPLGREYHKHLNQVQSFVRGIILKKKKDFNKNTHIMKCEMQETQVNGVHKVDGKEYVNNMKLYDINQREDEVEQVDICKDCNKPTCRRYDSCESKNILTLLDCLLKISHDDPTMTEKEITDQVNTFMFAGHDTISCAISFILFALGHHPEWQDAIIQELDQECPDILTLVPNTREILKGLPVLERCIKEALRLYSPSPMVGRNLRSPLETPAGILPAGTTAILYTHLLHRDPTVFVDPDKYNPDRFLSDNVSQEPFTYIPFSAGPRNCIGKTLATIELKIIVSMILKMFRVRSLQTVSQLDLCFEIVLTSPPGVLLQFIPRD